MPSLNQILIAGHLGRDPEVRMFVGNAVASFSVAATEKWKTQAGEPKEHTEWFKCKCWGKSGETLAGWLSKGDAIFVTGKIRTSEWTDQSGAQQRSQEVVVISWNALKTKSVSGGDHQSPQDSASPPRPASPPPAKPASAQADFDDDIPF